MVEYLYSIFYLQALEPSKANITVLGVGSRQGIQYKTIYFIPSGLRFMIKSYKFCLMTNSAVTGSNAFYSQGLQAQPFLAALERVGPGTMWQRETSLIPV